ncbi:tetratricopeptide repeat protein 16-like [Anableps anableps]
MDTSEKTNNQTSLFPTAVSEEKLDEARRKRIFRAFSERLQEASKCSLQRSDLPPGRIIVQQKAAEHFMKGKEAVEKFQYERAVICFSKAKLLQPEQVELHVSQGEAYIQLCDFQSAAECYHRASCQQPGAHNARLAFIYYLQGQCLFDGGLFLQALQTFKKAAELKPDNVAYRIKSLACLTAAGRSTECLQELNRLIMESPSAENYVLRAQVYKAINKISCCLQDVRSALEVDPTNRKAKAMLQQLKEASEEARQQAVLRMLSGHLQGALCLINTALESSPEDGRLYLFRGILFRHLKEFISSMEDLIQAAELSDSVQEEVQLQLALTYNDFGVQCFSRGLYAEATLLLNKAITEEKSLAGLYLNRGDCFFKQGDWCYALLDYQQAEEMLSPDEPALRLRLAVIHNTFGSFCFEDGFFQDAADMFSLALKYNPTVSQYYENRSKALRRVQNLRGAREDLIRLLILDPDNEEVRGASRDVAGRAGAPRAEAIVLVAVVPSSTPDLGTFAACLLDPHTVPPMLINLFPGSNVSEVMSSSKEQELRAELTETIRAWDSSFDPERSLETLRNMTVTDKKPESESANLSKAALELSLCVNETDLQKIAKALLQVEEAVEALVPDGPVLRLRTPQDASARLTRSTSTNHIHSSTFRRSELPGARVTVLSGLGRAASQVSEPRHKHLSVGVGAGGLALAQDIP